MHRPVTDPLAKVDALVPPFHKLYLYDLNSPIRYFLLGHTIDPISDRLTIAPNNKLDAFNGSRRLHHQGIKFSFFPERNTAGLHRIVLENPRLVQEGNIQTTACSDRGEVLCAPPTSDIDVPSLFLGWANSVSILFNADTTYSLSVTVST